MRIILSPDEMRSLEARYFEETGVASETLMERAAQGDLEARNTLIEHNLRLVAHIVKKG